MKKTLSRTLLESFNEKKPKVTDLSSTAEEELFDNKVINLYRCSDCNRVFSDNEMDSVRVDMEAYYGVGADFPDHHYENMSACPECKSVDFEDLGAFDLDDFEDGWKLQDEEDLNEASIFQRIAGPKRKQIRDYYKDITKNLFPLLQEFGIKMYANPMTQQPGKVVFAGNLDGKQIQIAFYNAYEEDKELGEPKDMLYCKVMYNSKMKDVGYIDISTPENADNAFSMITKTLEELGYITQADKEAQEQKAIEDNKAKEEEEARQYNENENIELPPKDLLNQSENKTDKADLQATSEMLVKTLADYDINAEVVDTHVGPAVTVFELKLQAGTKISNVTNLSKEISLALSAKNVRIEAPIPGRSTIGIEIPNKELGTVNLADILNNTEPTGVSIALGVDTNGKAHQADILKMQHVLVGGSTGSGKSAFINSAITSILMNYKPNEVKLILIDPKRVELNQFKDVPHLLMPIVNDPQKANEVLKQLVAEMEKRYKMFEQAKVKNIIGFNEQARANGSKKMHYIVCIIDELADLMMTAGKEVEASIQRITQLARAAGIHLVVATQRPSVDVVTGTIKSNIPSRISFATASGVDSRTILDQQGAEKLLGKGDMLYKPIGASSPTRLQGALTTDEEVQRVVDYYKGGN